MMGFGNESVGIDLAAVVYVLALEAVCMILYLRRSQNVDYEMYGLGSIFSRGRVFILYTASRLVLVPPYPIAQLLSDRAPQHTLLARKQCGGFSLANSGS
jgi:hypothetical protein